MGLKEVQKDVHDWTSQFTPQYWPPHEQLAALVEETGEVARLLNHIHGVKKKKEGEARQELGGELVDVMFALTCLANYHGVDLQAEWEKMMSERRYGRDNNRFDKVEGG